MFRLKNALAAYGFVGLPASQGHGLRGGVIAYRKLRFGTIKSIGQVTELEIIVSVDAVCIQGHSIVIQQQFLASAIGYIAGCGRS